MNMHQKVRKSPAVLPCAGELNAMQRKGMTQGEIARLFGVTVSAINVKLRRGGFARIRAYGGARVNTVKAPEQYTSPSVSKHPDRVTRVTFSGAHVTMPRLTFLDGPAQQSGE